MILGLIIGGAVGVLGLGLWLWWQRTPLAPGSIARRAPIPNMMRLRRSTIYGGALLLILLCLGTAWLIRHMWSGGKRATVTQELKPPPPRSVPPTFLDRFPTEYTQPGSAAAQSPEAPVQPEAPAPPATPTPPAATQTTQAPRGSSRAALPPPPEAPKPPQIVIQTAPSSTTPAPAPARYAPAPRPQPPPQATQPTPQTEESKRWFSSPAKPQGQGNLLKPPIPEDEKDKRTSQLFPEATWEKPADPYKILYADQVVPILLAQNIVTDAPGTVRLKVPEDVMDRWGHRNILIPRDSTFMAVQQGNAQFGQTRIPLGVYMLIFPNGAAMQWDNGQVGDEMGANGLPAHVNNHYLKLFTGVMLQAILQIGVRAPFGSPGTGQYQQNLPQEFAQQAGQGAGQAGQDIIRRQFIVPPTLSQDFGKSGTISFVKNVSFQSDPIMVKK